MDLGKGHDTCTVMVINVVAIVFISSYLSVSRYEQEVSVACHNHFWQCRNDIQPLVAVFANTYHVATAAGAGAGADNTVRLKNHFNVFKLV